MCVSLLWCRTRREQRQDELLRCPGRRAEYGEGGAGPQLPGPRLLMAELTILTVDGLADLISHLPDVVDLEGQEAVFLNEIIGAKPQQLEHNAHMAVMVKPF